MMQGEKKQLLYTMLAFVCASGVFLMSILFQKMAYWGGGLTWYWVGVALTFAIGVAGTAFILQSLKIKGSEEKTLLTTLLISLRALAILAIGLGFLWTTFIVSAGMSGF